MKVEQPQAVEERMEELMDFWVVEEYKYLINFIRVCGRYIFQHNIDEKFWKLSFDPMRVFRACHPDELAEGPKQIITSWTDDIEYAKKVAKVRGIDLIASIGLRRKDVVVLPFPILDMKYKQKVIQSQREREILVYDYFGKYEIEKKTAVLA